MTNNVGLTSSVGDTTPAVLQLEVVTPNIICSVESHGQGWEI